MDVVHLNQKQLAARWSISEATLERWRSVGIGPKFVKLCGRVMAPRTKLLFESTQSKRCGLPRTSANSIEKPAGL